ncbi:hypothetical protein D0X99_19785 [Algoriphagus lacus]|uniref:Uncharacterized protein n=1 Tax=Algoriphagus lacus TaxID=2056311 RepID=A0A418PLC4_9BACT|nr:hypothetical protein D0X99_19785 [Algoriphagus lacus]
MGKDLGQVFSLREESGVNRELEISGLKRRLGFRGIQVKRTNTHWPLEVFFAIRGAFSSKFGCQGERGGVVQPPLILP